MPSIASYEQSRLANAVKAAVAEAHPELAEEMLLVTERRPFFEEVFEFSRQQVILRDRLPVDLGDIDLTLRHVAAFGTGGDDRPRHVCALWIDQEAARRHAAGVDHHTPASAGHAEALARLQSAEPVFVVMDLPIGRHVGHWISQGVTVRIVTSPVERSNAIYETVSGRHPLLRQGPTGDKYA